ncbi:MAG: helix-turn-helix domain-containing protein [Clostridia bacterium]|nr:helix-turn-helix domain-containing protein [Clostridia bacterium]
MTILDVGRKAVYGLIHQKAFPAIKIPSVGYRIPKESFNAWLSGR